MKNKIAAVILILTFIFCIAAIAGCSELTDDTETTIGAEQTSALPGETATAEPTSIGKGERSFSLSVDFADGNSKTYKVSTDKESVGEALQELGLIEGEQGEFGLYVNTVDGVTLDYNKDKSYWAFYINGEYAMTGVDRTKIDENSVYELKIEKA